MLAGKSVVAPPVQPITLTDAALAHLKKLRAESGDAQLLLRMGVKSGGCSGMSCE
jgi:iron-sulfur cluster assembly protein